MANNLIRLKIENTTVYRGRVIVPGEEIVADAKTADNLVERNIASILGEEIVHDNEHDDEHDNANDELDGMTVDELKEYANEAGVDLKGVTKKADIIAAIREAM